MVERRLPDVDGGNIAILIDEVEAPCSVIEKVMAPVRAFLESVNLMNGFRRS